ncbi:hypothetical protein H0H93_006506 [Arthromyces matolae]|nr:hypothetical protein H0H93_006506 [Arthromyces matolae]
MVRSTIIVRASDALPLAASVDDEQTEQSLQEHKQQAKLIFRRITPNSEPRCSIESNQYTLHYLISDNVVFLTIADKSYPRKLAFSYLDELSKEFSTSYGPKVESVRKPYAFVGFDTFMSKTARLYRDTRTAAATSSLDKLNDDLQDVTRIMTKNMEELLWRGDSLDRMSHLSTSLRSESEKYRKAARNMNFNAMIRQYAPLGAYLEMQRAASPYRAPSPYRATSPYHPPPPAGQHYQDPYANHQQNRDQTPAVGSITYTTSAGPDGRPLYHLFKTRTGDVRGVQWIPGETVTTLPPGAQPATGEFAAAWSRKDERWPARGGDVEAKRNHELDDDLRKARALDAHARERRQSFNASSPPGGAYAFPTAGSTGSQHSRGPYSVYGDRPPTSNGGYSDIDRQMGDLNLHERERKISTHAPRPQYGPSVAGDRPRSPHPSGRPESRAAGPYGASTASGAYTAGRPYSAAGYQPSTSPNQRVPEGAFIPPVVGYSPNRAPDPLPRSTTPYGGGGAGGPAPVYPRGHVMEGQPLLPQDRERMSPMPRAHSPALPGPYSSSAVSMSAGPPRPLSRGPPPSQHNQLAAPEGFSRAVNGSHPFTPFDMFKIQDMEKFWSEAPRMPTVLTTHDVFEADWRRLMQDMTMAWAGRLPIPDSPDGPPPRRSAVLSELIDCWNKSFFYVRGAELVLFRGLQRRSGSREGATERHLPHHEEPDDYISSADDDTEYPDSDPEYGAGRYHQHAYAGPQQQMADILDEGRRRKETKLAERRKRRQERHRRRREKCKARKYSLYMNYYPTNVPGYGGHSGFSSGGGYGDRY